MPSRTSALALAAVAALGLATGCEKQNPFVTLTADGVVVKAKAVNYCRGDDCRTTDDVPTLRVTADAATTLGVDVPRSLAEQGWRVDTPLRETEFGNLHYRAFPLSLEPGAVVDLMITRNPEHGAGTWRFKIEAVRE